MAPSLMLLSGWEVRNAGPPQQGKNSSRAAHGNCRRSGLLLFDIVNDLGHVVLVLAELGSVLDQFFLLFLGLFERNALFLLFLGCFGLLDLDIGIDVLGSHRLQLSLDRCRRARPTGLDECLGIERRAAFRADHRIPHHIVIARAAARADALAAPFGFRHCGSLWKSSLFKDGRRAIATAIAACQKQILDGVAFGSRRCAEDAAPARATDLDQRAFGQCPTTMLSALWRRCQSR